MRRGKSSGWLTSICRGSPTLLVIEGGVMERDPFSIPRKELARRRSRRQIIRDGLIAGGSFAASAWLPGSRVAKAQDLATPIAVPGSAGVIGRPETVPIDHLIVIFLENRPFDHLYGLFPGANGLSAHGATIPQTNADG